MEAHEGFAWQVAAVRRHLSDLPGEAPEAAHLRGITDAVPADPMPTPALRLCLTAYAYFLEHEARLDEALDVLGLAGRAHGTAVPPAEFSAIALFAGRLNRLLARWPAANTCYERAEEAASSVSDSVTTLRSRLGRCAVLRGQGNLPLALTNTKAVADEAGVLNLPEIQAMAYTDLGAVYALQGAQDQAVISNYRAFTLTEDPVQRMRILGDLGVGLLHLNAYETARLAFEIVAGSQASLLVRTNAILELMEPGSEDRQPAGVRAPAGGGRGGARADAAQHDGGLPLQGWHRPGQVRPPEARGGAAPGRAPPGGGASPEHLVLPIREGIGGDFRRASSRPAQESSAATPASTFYSPAMEEVAVGLREYALAAN